MKKFKFTLRYGARPVVQIIHALSRMAAFKKILAMYIMEDCDAIEVEEVKE